MQARLYEAMHKWVKKAYGRAARKRKSVTQKVINQKISSVYKKHKKERNNITAEKQKLSWNLKSAGLDGTCIVRNGAMTTLIP